MKISKLRRLYPSLNNCKKNVKWRQLLPEEINKILQEEQVVSNCYEESVRYSLLKSPKGLDLIRKRIKKGEKDNSSNHAYKFIFKVNSKDEAYRGDKLDCYSDSYLYVNYSDYYLDTKIRVGEAACIAISKMLSKHPEQKPFIIKLFNVLNFFSKSYEYNKPSNAFRWYTGKEPIVINEYSTDLSLEKYKEDVFQILNNFNNQDDCFIGLTRKKNSKHLKWHCLSIVSVDKKK